MLDWNDLLIRTKDIDAAAMLKDWKWLLRKDYHPVVLTVFGDWFLQDDDGAVFLLDLVGGELTKAADSGPEFQEAMQEEENMDSWFLEYLVEELLRRGVLRGPGQCYGYKTPPILGGRLEADNIEARDIRLHQTVMSHLHQQARELKGKK